MISWSARHQLIYLGFAIIFILLILFLPIYLIFHKSSGGNSCVPPCAASALPINIFWQRAFKVTDGVYNVVAYVENPNRNAGIVQMPYLFKIYDDQNIIINERRGSAFIPPGKTIGIFEGVLETGTRVPVRTFFEFDGLPLWQTLPEELPLNIINKNLSGADNAPRLEATLENRNLMPVYDTEVVAIIYNADGNAITASRTTVDFIDKNSSAPVFFTWPEPFTDKPSRIEMIYRILPR